MYRGIILSLSIEIISMILIIFITIPIWDAFKVNEMQEVAKYYDNYYYIDYEVTNNENNNTVRLFNESYTTEKYYLVLVVDDELTKNVNDTKIIVNGEEKNVNNFKVINKNNKTLIIIDKGSLVAAEKIYNIDILNNKNSYEIKVVEKI